MRFLGGEVTQGLPDYELVAGKDTLVRAFVGREPQVVLAFAEVFGAQAPSGEEETYEEPNNSGKDEASGARAAAFGHTHIDVPIFGTVSIDYAELTVSGPNGLRFTVPGDIGDGLFSNVARSFSEEDNLNFYVDGANLARPGQYDFEASLYRDGRLVGALALGRHRFHPTKDLRLLIVVDTWPMPVSAWTTLLESLRYVHRNFPVRSGIGPLDGALDNGLRYLIEPVPFDPDFPAWGPVRQRLDAFNASQQAAGRPDRAEHILTVRVQQDFENPLGGVGESGPGGRVAGVTLNNNPPADDVFATLIAQELGHNFIGSAHTPDPGIDEEAAFNLLDRAAVATPKSIMFGFYTGTLNPEGFFLPGDWRTIRQGLLAKDSTGPG
jgi:hypothetical protein